MKSHISEREVEIEAATAAPIARISPIGALGFTLATSRRRSPASCEAFAVVRRIRVMAVGKRRSSPID
jgi:hypothetical protein